MIAVLVVAILLSLPLKLLIPLIFGAIWALTWLVTRGHHSLPPGPTRQLDPIRAHSAGPGATRRLQIHVRFTLQQMILTVAVLCAVLAGIKAYREWDFSCRVAFHAREEASWSKFIARWPAAKVMVDYHSRRKRAYEQATFLTIIADEAAPSLASLPPPPAPTPSPKPIARLPVPSPARGVP
jgi:hypothetical protein